MMSLIVLIAKGSFNRMFGDIYFVVKRFSEWCDIVAPAEEKKIKEKRKEKYSAVNLLLKNLDYW